jgi:hypothetical protein
VPTPPTSLYVLIEQSDYGFLSTQTQPGAVCNAKVTLPNGQNAGGVRNPQIAGSNGRVQWIYPQPSTNTGQGVEFVTCTLNGLGGTSMAAFQVGA